MSVSMPQTGMDGYSLLEPAGCPSTILHHKVKRKIFGEMVQIKNERVVLVFDRIRDESIYLRICRRSDLVLEVPGSWFIL